MRARIGYTCTVVPINRSKNPPNGLIAETHRSIAGASIELGERSIELGERSIELGEMMGWDDWVEERDGWDARWTSRVWGGFGAGIGG